MMATNNSRVLFVGESSLGALGLEVCLERAGYEVLPACQDEQPATAAIEERQPALVIVGMLRPLTRAFRLCRRLTEHWPGMPVIVTCWRPDDELYVADVAYAGASACVDATISCEDMLVTIRRVLSGSVVFPRHLIQYAHSVDPLTPREGEILSVVARGMSVAEITAELGIAANTIHNIARDARSKLGVHTTAEAAARAERRGLLD